VLRSHRAYDIGAREVAEWLGQRLGAEPELGEVSRLVVDLNRSTHHRSLFSDFTRGLAIEERQRSIERVYRPYRKRVKERVERALAREQVLHVAVHSFTPVLAGARRRADVGLLYDPARELERRLCRAWQQGIKSADGSVVVRMNYPYRGTADGLITSLRRELDSERYAGVELEINQRYARSPSTLRLISEAVLAGLRGTQAVARGEQGRR
jgi:predicted N-formylglutamate amidohydrolase